MPCIREGEIVKYENQTPRERAIELIGAKAVRELEKAGFMIVDQREFQAMVIRDEMREDR